MKKALTLTAVLAVCAVANAAITTTFVLVEEGKVIEQVPYNVWDMMVDTDTDWTNSRMDISLTSGAMFQHSLGGNTAPLDAWVALYPDLAFDTYATVPNNLDVTFAGAITMDATTYGASWADTPVGDAGQWVIARITLTQDANGDVTGKSYDVSTAGEGLRFDEYYIEDGHFVPEPATLSVLALGAAALLRRRR